MKSEPEMNDRQRADYWQGYASGLRRGLPVVILMSIALGASLFLAFSF